MRLIVADFLTGLRLGEWHATGVQWEVERDKPGTISGSIIDPHPSTILNRPHAVHVVYPDGSVPWTGIVWGVWPSSYDSTQYRFEGAGWTSILDFRKVRVNLSYNDVEQATIVNDLLVLAQYGANATLPWTLTTPSTGRARDVTIKGEDRKSVLKYLTDWCDNIDGWDFRVVADVELDLEFQLLYPRDSRETHTILSRPGVQVGSWEDDWTFVANNIDITGKDDLAYTTYANPETNWPRMDAEFSAESVSVMQTLIDKAARYRDLLRYPLVEAEVIVTDGTSGVDWIGHDVRVIDSDVSGRDDTFQLTKVTGSWEGAVPKEVWTLEQTLRQEEV